MKVASFLLPAAALLLTSASARADDAEDEIILEQAPPSAPSPSSAARASTPEDEAGPEKQWYGWQTLLVDGASLVTSPAVVGIPGVFLGAPIVHLAHHNGSAAFASLAIRGAAAGTALYGLTRDHGHGDFAGFAAIPYLAAGAVITSAAIALDASVFAYEEKRPAPAVARVSPSASLPPGGGLMLGVGGAL